MNALKRILSVIMVLAMLLSCMGAAPFEAVAGQEEQEGVTVSDMIEVENVPSEPEPVAEPVAETEPAVAPAEETEPVAAPAEETESAAEPAEETEPTATEPAEETEPAAEPAEETESAAEPAEVMTLSLDDGIMPIAEPAAPTIVETTWSGTEGLSYTGSQITNITATSQEATEKGYTEGPSYSYVGKEPTVYPESTIAPTDAGDYTVTATWAKSDNPDDTVSASQPFTIKPAELTVTISGGALIYTQDYKGSAYTIGDSSINFTVTGAQGNDVITASAVFWDENNEKRTDPVIDAGNYRIGYELTYGNAKDTNYEVQPFDAKTLTINKAAVTLTLADSAAVVYTGENAVLTSAQFTAPKLADGDTLVSVVTDAVKAGEYQGADIAVTKILAKRAGSDDAVDVTANYDPITLTGMLTIEPKKLQAENVQNNIEEAIYDGTVQKKQPEITVNGVPISADEFDFAYDPEEPVNVGVVTVTVTAKTDGNYAFDGVDSVKRTYEIKPLSITDSRVKVEGLDPLTSPVTYTGAPQPPKLTVSFNGEPMDESDVEAGNHYTVTYNGAAASDEVFIDAGEIEVVITGHGNFGDSRTEHYTIDQKNLEDAKVTVKDEPTYTGSELTPEVEVVLDGVTLKETTDYTLEWNNNINAGENTASVTVKGKGNYTGTTREQMFMIKPIVLEITSGSDKKTYDGTPLKKEEAKVTTGAFVSGQGATYTYTGAQTDVGKSPNTFTYTLNEGTLATNYEITLVPGELEVTTRSVTLTSATKSKEYDGTPLTDSTVTAEGFVEGEGATYDVTGTQTLPGSSDNAFTYTLNEGTKADNYVIKEVVGTLTVEDRTKPFEFTITAKSDETSVYDGKEHTVSGFVGNDKVTIGQDGTITVTEMVGETPVKYTVEGLTASAAGTDAGVYTSKVTGTAVVKDENGTDVTRQFKVTPVDGTLTINKKELSAEDVLYSVLPTVTYNGTAYEPKPVVTYGDLTLVEGRDYELHYADNIAAGTATVTVEALEKNYTGSKTLKFTIAKQSLDPEKDSTVSADASWEDFVDTFTIDTEDEKGFVYDGKAHQWEPKLTYMQGYVKDGAAGTSAELPTDEYTVSYTRDGQETEDFTNVGTITVTITGKGTNFAEDSISFSYDITKKPVTVKAAGAKLFGAVDPKFAVGATAEDAAVHDADNWLMVTFDGIVPGEEKLFDGKDGDDVLTVKTAQRDPGDDMEQPGKYAIDVTVDDTKATNYKVTVDENVGAFTISDKAAFTVTLGDTEKADDIDTHTLGQVKYDIVANQGQKLIPNLQSYINVSLLVDVTGVAGNYVTPDAPDALTKNVPESIAQDVRTDAQAGTAASADADKTGTFTIPAIAYSAQHEGTSPLTWHSGLPAGTKLTVKIVSSKEGASTIATVISPEIVTVVAKAADMSSEYAAGAGKNAFLDGDPSANGRVVLDAGGTVTIKPADGKEYIGADDWITLTVGGKTYHYSVFSYSELLGGAAPAADGTLVLNLNMLKALAGVSGEEGGWFGANPTGKLTVSAVVFDGVNHTVGTTTLDVAFDTGAVDSSQTVENRITAETLKLAISDSVNAAPNVAAAGQFGGASITEDIAAVGGASGTLTWNNVTKWMQTPETLAHSGNTITITYLDCVGNQVNHTLTVVRSAAVTSNTLYVQPMKNDTVPGKSLTFYGETNAWEQGILTIGGTSFPVEPIAGGDTYDNSTKRWQVVINLGDINFPVGEPTTVSMAYEDLNGGEATIRITYKDQAQTPILSSEPIEGSQALWGYVESGASVSVSVYHTDGTVTQIPQDNIAVDQFGYFYVRLSSPLAEGEQVVVSTSDFCDNQKSFTVSVQKELKADATAEVLGANIIGELMGTTNIQHRFATPIDLGALDQAENKTMTLPILAYKSIEIGKVTFSLKTPGKMNVSYNIKSTNSIPVGGAARMKTFDYKPTIDELVGGELSTVVKDLKTAPAGNIPAIDVSAYQAEDGTYGGIIWLQFEFDVDMTEDNFVSRGGRDARFYRWLTESLQTEGVLGAVYQETSAYEDNVGYYNQYQRFENISKMS